MGARKQWRPGKGIMSRRYTAQRGRCYICNGRMATGMSKSNMPNVASRDHVFPRSTHRLYFDHTRNILLAHSNCNNRKGDREPYACEVLYLEVTNNILYGYEENDDPSFDLSDWQPIPPDALEKGEAPYDGNTYDVWFKGTFWIGYREADIEWEAGDINLWCDRDGRLIEVTPGMKETHYMISPTSPLYGKNSKG